MEKVKPVVLVLCAGNSCRSQMAEGFLRARASDQFDVRSAGTDPKDEVHPLAVRVMQEVGIDIGAAVPTGVGKYLGRLSVRYLIIVCAQAEQNCPRIFPGTFNRLFWPFDDPAAAAGTEAQRLREFRRVRDEIGQRIDEWLRVVGPTTFVTENR